MLRKKVIIIAGPTAAGKTALAIDLALHLNTTIISADSRQCFRELNIGVAKPTPEELQRVKHEFINSHSIHDEVNAARFEELSLNWAEDIFKTHDVVVVVGGTGLYIKAFCEGLDAVPPADEQLRIEIKEQYEQYGISWLQEQIRQRDPEFHLAGETRNPQRMMRALEVKESTGRSILSFHGEAMKTRPFQILYFGLQLTRAVLNERINERVDTMMQKGLLEEVKSLVPFRNLNALQTVGYTELFEHLAGNIGLDEAVARIKQNTRHYAKRQMTWFKKNPAMYWLEKDPLRTILEHYQSA
ncbi:MAG TPA: tRNA (adenosine(37)-N6)-dimethylallyltransferase MiaA [Puia sp.]|nr:tRNA (adenosine(37)-N6)-dimethylallyltransferase MiaA [Puia sp.]